MTKARGSRVARTLERLSGSKKLALSRTKRLARLPDLLVTIVYQRQQLLRTVAHGKDIVHGGAPLAQQALEVGIAFAHMSELTRVKRYAIAISTQLIGAIFE